VQKLQKGVNLLFVGICRLELLLAECSSLKDKRQVIRSLIERLKNRFNISIAEVDFQDTWQRTKIAMAIVSSARNPAEIELQKALKFIDSFPEIERTITDIEWL